MISARVQGGLIRDLFPSFEVSYPGGGLVAHGVVQPTPRSVSYRTRITYLGGDRPLVHVLAPELVPRASGEAIPHVYPENRLCLYVPGRGEWSDRLLIAQTIIP